jgi:phosphoglycolate phosphatase-like HAD superfamily hydrolase
MRDLFAVDFDGVLCDSAAETGGAAWRAVTSLWPEWAEEGSEPPAEYLRRFLALRSLVEFGFQAVLLMRLIGLGLADGAIRVEPLEDESRLRERTGCGRAELTALLGEAREAWIARDREGWLRHHRFYPGLVPVLAQPERSRAVRILTTKQERFVVELLRSQGIGLPANHIFGLNPRKSKEDVLEDLLNQPELDGCRIHFVEDRLETLLRVAARPELAEVQLYLASWGYNTAAERDRAREHPRLTLLRLPQFAARLGEITV